MTSVELAYEVARQTGFRPSAVLEVMRKMAVVVESQLVMGKKVNFIYLGHFKPVRRAPRKGRTLQGGTIDIPARIVPRWSTSKKLVERLNGSKSAFSDCE